MPARRIELLAAVVGAASLGAEIAAARLLAPWFGASTIVWANTIATVLVALSIGYAVGGRLADRRPTMDGLCALVLAAAVLLAGVPFAARPFLGTALSAFDSLSVGAFLGSLIGVLALVAVPVLLLGAVAPFAVRLSVRAVEESGRVSGRLYAISTVGSLTGTFLSALLLIPLLGTRRTFLAFALALAVVALPGVSRRFVLIPIALAALLALPPGTVKSAPGERVVTTGTIRSSCPSPPARRRRHAWRSSGTPPVRPPAPTDTSSRPHASTPSNSTASSRGSAVATSTSMRRACGRSPPTRGPSSADRGPAMTRSSSMPIASPTSPST
jgi:hypothetical protein